jgi:hypothetical protein
MTGWFEGESFAAISRPYETDTEQRGGAEHCGANEERAYFGSTIW